MGLYKCFKIKIYFVIITFAGYDCRRNTEGFNNINNVSSSNQYCLLDDYLLSIIKYMTYKNDNRTYNEIDKSIYILYDINSSEGFNLRRDVYIRMAVFVRNLKKNKLSSFNDKNIKLVLPPFPRLYHWKSSHIEQDKLFWNHFFDIKNLKLFTTVLDFYEFLNEIQTKIKLSSNCHIKIDNVIQLQHFDEMFTNGVFIDKFEFVKCPITKLTKSSHQLLGYNNLTADNFTCLKFQGSSSLLEEILQVFLNRKNSYPKTILFLNAEIILHDHWGNKQYWQARRSMRFNSNLIDIANSYRLDQFNSSNDKDLVQRPNNWKDEKEYRKAIGGEYLCAHLRRSDFIYGHEQTTPSLKSAANQIRAKLKELKLQKIFISSDCSAFEFKNLKSYLGKYKVYRFTPESYGQKQFIKDGGQAIIDQIICSHARYFIGTYESTFTYRIYEEREILGFPIENTFNTFCKKEEDSSTTKCEKNSIWPIVY